MDFKEWLKEQEKTFVIAQIIGCVMLLFGLVYIFIHVGQKVSVTNLKPAINMVVGFFVALLGLILIAISYRIRWQHRVETKLNMLLWVTGMADEEESPCSGCCEECSEDCSNSEQEPKEEK